MVLVVWYGLGTAPMYVKRALLYTEIVQHANNIEITAVLGEQTFTTTFAGNSSGKTE